MAGFGGFGSQTPFGSNFSSGFGQQSGFGSNNNNNTPFNSSNTFGAAPNSNPFGQNTSGAGFFSSPATTFASPSTTFAPPPTSAPFASQSSSFSSSPAFGQSSGFASSSPHVGTFSNSFGGSSSFPSSTAPPSTNQFSSSPFGGQSNTSAFGSTTFGSPPSSTTQFGGQQSMFGSTIASTPATGGPYGGQGVSNPFGSNVGSTAGTMFGASSTIAPATQNPSFSLFGGSAPATSFAAPSSSMFGAPTSSTFPSATNSTTFATSSTFPSAAPQFGFSSSTAAPFSQIQGFPSASPPASTPPPLTPFGQSSQIGGSNFGQNADDAEMQSHSPIPFSPGTSPMRQHSEDEMADAPLSNLPFGTPPSSLSPIPESRMASPVPDTAKQDELDRIKAKIEEKKKKMLELRKKKEEASKLNADAPAFVPRVQLPDDLLHKADETGVEDDAPINARGNLENAISLVGTCPYMCPDEELLRRQRENDIQLLELPMPGKLHPENWTIRETMVKRFRRSAADYKLDVPEWVRPPDVLEKVCGYLEEWVMERDRQGPDPRFPQNIVPPSLDVYQFIWDRTRMVRKDFILQNYVGTGGNCDARAVRCHERIARWHAMCEHQLSHIPDFVTMQSQQNIQELGQTMKTLNQYYDDSLHRSTVEVPDADGKETRTDMTQFSHGCISNTVQGLTPVDYNNEPLQNDDDSERRSKRLIGKEMVTSDTHGTAEPEMRALYILLTLDNDGGMEVLKYAARLYTRQPAVYRSKEVQLALKVYKAKKEDNYARFFSILRSRSTPYLFSCIMFIYVERMRKSAFRIMSKAYGGRSKENNEAIYDAYPLKNLVRMLCFEDLDEARAACQHFNITVKPTKIRSSTGVVKTEEIIFWKQSPFKEPKDPDKGTEIPLKPKKMLRTIEAKVKGATRLGICRGELSRIELSAVAVRESLSSPSALSPSVKSQNDDTTSEHAPNESQPQTIQMQQQLLEKFQRDEKLKNSAVEDERAQIDDRQRSEQIDVSLAVGKEAQLKAQLEEARKKRILEKMHQESIRIEKEKVAARRAAEEKKKSEEIQKQIEETRRREAAEAQRRREEEEAALRKVQAQRLAKEEAEQAELRRIEQERVRIERLKREAEAQRKKAEERAEEERRKAEELRRKAEEQRRKEEELRKREEEQRRKEEEQRRKAEIEAMLSRQWNDKSQACRRRLTWMRLMQGFPVWSTHFEGNQENLRKLGTADTAQTDFVVRSSKNLRVSPRAHPSGTRTLLETVIKRNATGENLASIIRQFKEDQQPRVQTLLYKIAVILPLTEDPVTQSLCDLFHTWVSSQLQVGMVQACRNGAIEIRVVVVDDSAPLDARSCDGMLIVIPPPFADSVSLDKPLVSIANIPDDDIPRVVLRIGECFVPEFVKDVTKRLGELYRGNQEEVTIVSNRDSTENALQQALWTAMYPLCEKISHKVPIIIERFTLEQLCLETIGASIWRITSIESREDIIRLARYTIQQTSDAVERLRNDLRSAVWPYPEFSDARGVVDSYFGPGEHLPADWRDSLGRVRSSRSQLLEVFTGSFSEIIDTFLTGSPDILRWECDDLLENRAFRRCFHLAWKWFVEYQHRAPSVEFMYIPKALVKRIVENTTESVCDFFSSQLKLVAYHHGVTFETDTHLAVKTSESNNATDGQPQTPVESKAIPQVKRSWIELESPIYDILLYSEDDAALKRRRTSRITSPERRISGNLAESRAFTKRLAAFASGSKVRDMIVGGKPLSTLLKGAPKLNVSP